MTFDQLWDQLCNKSPALKRADSTLEFKPDNLKRLLRQVYEQGQKSSERKADIFESMFGGMRR